MAFSRDFIERVQEANNLVDIISQYTQLKPTGSGLMGRCPFPDHQEKTPSFSLSEAKQVYHCFGCHRSGNIFSFLRDYQGMAFPDAVEFLAGRAGIPLPEPEHGRREVEDQVQEKRKQLMKVNQIAKSFFFEQLKRLAKDHPTIQYIQKRGLTQETIDAFQIGFAPKEWDSLTQHLSQKEIPSALSEEARLIVARKEKSGHFDMFRNRLMFPIMNTMGDAVAFGGRVLSPEDNPKYLNSPETPVFEKKKVLYGLHQTARHIRSEDSAVIVEGYMDAVSLYQSGIRNVAAVMSSSLTPEQARLLTRMTKNIIMLLDGDDAGMDGAERSLPILLHAGTYPKGVFLPNGMDPDDFVKANGAQALQDYLANAQDLLFIILDRWMENYRGEPAEKVKLSDKLKPVFEVVADPRLKELYLQEVARKLGVSIQWLSQALGQGGLRPSASVRISSNREVPTQESQHMKASARPQSAVEGLEDAQIVLKGSPKAEVLVMALAIKSRANFETFAKENMLNCLQSDGVKKILERASSIYGQEPQKFDKLPSLLVSFVDQPELLFSNEPASVASSEVDSDGVEAKLLKDAIRRVRENFLKGELKRITRELAQNPSSQEKMEQLMMIQKDINFLNKG